MRNNVFRSFFNLFFKMKIFSFHLVPQKSSHPNGIKCPACYSVDDISCEPDFLTCTGAETKCVNVIGISMNILPVF